MKKAAFFAGAVLIIAVGFMLFTTCDIGVNSPYLETIQERIEEDEAASDTAARYSVLYNGNGNEAGTVPEDTGEYREGESAEVLGNIHTLTRTGYTFSGWNTAANGGGVTYTAGDTLPIRSSDVVLYALWTANTYTITFYKNDIDAAGTMDVQSIAYDTAAALTICEYTKPGWAFLGWATSPEGSVEYTDGQNYTMGAADVDLYAQWEEGFSVTFDKNDPEATGTMAVQVITKNTTEALNTCTFEKAGYSFQGWAITPDGGVQYVDGANYTMGGADVTLYAKWSVNQYTLTFDKNSTDATGSMADQTFTYGTSQNLTANGFSRSGYTFAGWSSSPGGSVEYADQASYTIGSSDTTLYAQWNANTYYISFDKNDDAATGTMSSQEIVYSTSEPLEPCTFSKTGWSFAGWSTSPSGPVEYEDGAQYTMGLGDTTLYAQWTADTFYITFVKNDPEATGSMADQGIACDSTEGLHAVGFSKEGWSFTGWSTTTDGSVEYADQAEYTMGSADITLYAQWTANIYSVIFDKNDPLATGTMANQDIACGSTAQLQWEAFSKTDWFFAGWALTPDGPVAYLNRDFFTMGASDVTLYAVWIVQIIYNGNDYGAEGSMDRQTIESGTTENLYPNTFTKEGWTFAGWATSQTGPVEYSDCAPFTMGDAVVRLYAQWTPPGTFSIGDRGPAGGWVFYDKGSSSNGWRYLEAGYRDLATGYGEAVWGEYGRTVSGADGTAIGTGEQNTIDIINGDPSTNNAAHECHDHIFTNGGVDYEDWFLPSLGEMQTMHSNLHTSGLGNFYEYDWYWSSSEYSAQEAWQFYFETDKIEYRHKQNPVRCRPIRAFE